MSDMDPQSRSTERIPEEPDTILRETIEIISSGAGDLLDSVTIERLVVGVFFTGVKLSNGYGGICYTPVDLIPETVCCSMAASAMPNNGNLIGLPVTDVLTHVTSPGPLVRAVIISLINALSAWYMDLHPDRRYRIEDDTDAFSLISSIPPDRPVVVIGALWPAVHRIKSQGNPYYIFELNPDALRDDERSHYVPPDRQKEVLKGAGGIVITGSTLVTSTLEGILAGCPPSVPVIIGGPTVSMLPDAFFSRGVTAIGGDIVTKPDELLDAIMQGGSGFHFFGTSARKILIRKPE